MVLRRGWVIGLGLTLAAGPAFGQAQPNGGVQSPPRANPITMTKAPPRAAPGSKASLAPPGTPHTLAEALAATYSTQPQLLAERAKLRATDENVPQALSGWRPTVIMAGTTGYGDGMNRQFAGGGFLNTRTDRLVGTAQATLTQPLYNGGKTPANINRAKNQVMAERATLIQQEQTSFTNVVTAYVGVIQAQQTLALNVNNEQVLAKQLQATNDRFRVGEITRTDVAQAEAALAGATAQRQTSEGQLQTARGTYQQVVGFLPPGDLVEPQPLSLPTKNEQDAIALAANNNPTVVAALFNDAANKDAVDVAFAQLLPQVSFQGQMFQNDNSGLRSTQQNGYQALLQLSVPVYPGRPGIFLRPPGPADPAAVRETGGRRAAHCGPEFCPVMGDAGRRKGLGRQHACSDPGQFNRARRCRARGHRRQPHHARRVECATGATAIAGHVGAEPRAGGDGVVPGGGSGRPPDGA